ncbi:unnamed protein product [Adineta steineri]|uniref:CSD domain-containing protein n=1 Tax=Adineta steineri TaxID=433720 RepID=A0A813V690_9BILA|nr:unnamed protein product [Adineta steineri]CAF4077023.1 unnamed protein product [Adineta steineri]
MADNTTMKGLHSPVNVENSGHFGEFSSSNSVNPPIIVKDICILPDSDPFDETKDYVGLIIYLYKGQSEFMFNGRNFRTGDIIIKESDGIFATTPKRRRREKYVHGRLFYSTFGCWKLKKLPFVCGGFSYNNKQWKFNSGTLNTMNPVNNNDTYHNTDRKLSDFEENIIRKMKDYLYINHSWLSYPPKSRFTPECLEQLVNQTTVKSAVYKYGHLSDVHPQRQVYGTVVWFDYYRGYGFIECIGFKEDVLVHSSAIIDQPYDWCYLNRGEHVLFTVIKSYRGWQAVDVIRIK